MSNSKIPIVEEDFLRVVSLLQERALIPTPIPANMLKQARSIHACTYSLMLWRYRFQKLPVHSKVYLEEIASDALQILPQVVLGYNKTVQLLCRGILENTLRHVYFHDHPIEFARTNREKWFLSFEELFQYTKIHPTFIATETEYNAIGRMKHLYGQLSAAVHGGAIKDLEMRSALKKLTYLASTAQEQVDTVRLTSQLSNFVLAAFHCGPMSRLDLADRRVILRGMERAGREKWTEFSSG